MKKFFRRSHSAQYLFHLALVFGFLILGATSSWAIVVTNTNNSGTGSLRQAVLDANADGVPTAITFDPQVFPATIFIQSELPALIGAGDSIDGHVNGDRAVIDGGCLGPDPRNFICPLPNVNGIRVQAANVSVSGLIIQRFSNNGIDISPPPSVLGVKVPGVSILDNKILEIQFDGITVSGGQSGNQVEVNIIDNEVFTNGDDNITVFGSEGTGDGGNIVEVVISGNTIKGAIGIVDPTFTGDGIRVTAGVGHNVGNNRVTALISDNVFKDVADSAVSIIGGAANGSSSDNIMNVTISGNTAKNSGLGGNGTSYTLSAGSGFPTTSTGNVLTFAVVDNLSEGVVGPGIFVGTGNGSGQVVSGTIANNTIRNSENTEFVASGDGIIIITQGDPASLQPPLPESIIENLIIEGNTITNNQGRGILITHSGANSNTVLRNILIDGNRIDQNDLAGILISGGGLNSTGALVHDVTVSNNQVTKNLNQGIIITGGGSITGIDVLSNNVQKNGTQGILVTGGTSQNATISDVLIDGNTSNTNGNRGIQATLGATAINPQISLAGITNNTTNTNVDDGLFVASGIPGNNTQVSGNRSDSNGVDGIDLNSTGYVVSNNTASRNTADGINAVSGNTNGGGNTGKGNGSCNQPFTGCLP